MTATPAPGGIDEYHSTDTTARGLRNHLHYGHDQETTGLDFGALVERHRQTHAGEDALQRGAAMGEAFAGLGRKIPEGPASAAPVPSGQSSEGAAPSGPPAAPSGPDPAAQLAKAFVEAVRRLGNREISPTAVETVLAEDIRKALRSYR